MPSTYEPISTTTLNSATTAITFSGIPNSYTDLRLVFSGTTTTGTSIYLRINSDTGTNYSRVELYGNGGSAFSSRGTGQTAIGLVYDNVTTPMLVTADLFSYAGSTFKTVITSASQDINGSGSVGRNVGMWRSTSAITSVSVLVLSGNIASGSTATIYGILKA